MFAVSERKVSRRKRRLDDDEDDLEEHYEESLSKRRNDVRRVDEDHVEVLDLLPIKCKETGVVRRTLEITKREFCC